ncbi:MAG: hypothetical protein ACD_16C00099G0024 [uncultured bacterium]|nr:MAG: hypothetical protein ACD_16C00099G0024 [uncultured bacterium]OFW68136.1 MAG: hypothetical protein A2X70_05500 [Alphaproteobacteria bacterium GWC2_42_16]OFW73529.1 MAG: hypothetical protein A2Z80_06800 [Alphaproteobacteria bacterium GWA2_41_27]OFW82378.1 MAG: hypothetical protein A3E50_04200 [Alphaproteobacteria bacterium RIFCSPHIGHO2_12_FULL_42_100]OFW86204.1 MAG: hypothetical protein A2W06_01130 [Alphaproteobacteria bacterium RBG_16_42_14]OFW91762.1 MAG: hypothetical protein A3C41_011
MLKFDIIESDEDKYKSNGLRLMMTYIDPSILSETKDISYILVEGMKENVVGGAILIKKDLSNIQEDIRILVTDTPFQRNIWECPYIFSRKSEEKGAFNDDFSHQFYRGLYEKLVEFGKRKGAGFLIMKLTPEIYRSTKEEGKWPYVVELKPENSQDALFHGILPLVGRQYEAYQMAWKI